MCQKNFLSLCKNKDESYQLKETFNQGVVSINLPQIGLIAKGKEEQFWKELDERLELCKEALMCRHYALLGTKSDVSPIHWQHGAISRLKEGEKIDPFLREEHSTLSLAYVGLYEAAKRMTKESHTTPKGHEFARKIVKRLKEATKQWKKETNLDFILYTMPEQSSCYAFAKIDKERFGTIKDITDKGYYTNSYQIDKREKIEAMDKLIFEEEFQKVSSKSYIPYVETMDKKSFCEFLCK